jgi:hypothetical protein
MYVINVISTTRLKGMRHVTFTGEKLNAYGVFMNNLNIGGCYDDVSTDGRIALKCILRKRDGCGLNSSGKLRNSC